MAASPAIRQNIPTRPRAGSVHGLSATGMVAGSVLMLFLYHSKIAREASLVFPVRIFRMLDVPKRPSAPHLRQNREVVVGWRRRSCPLERHASHGSLPARRPWKYDQIRLETKHNIAAAWKNVPTVTIRFKPSQPRPGSYV